MFHLATVSRRFDRCQSATCRYAPGLLSSAICVGLDHAGAAPPSNGGDFGVREALLDEAGRSAAAETFGEANPFALPLTEAWLGFVLVASLRCNRQVKIVKTCSILEYAEWLSCLACAFILFAPTRRRSTGSLEMQMSIALKRQCTLLRSVERRQESSLIVVMRYLLSMQGLCDCSER
jgi:hypothetical protein